MDEKTQIGTGAGTNAAEGDPAGAGDRVEVNVTGLGYMTVRRHRPGAGTGQDDQGRPEGDDEPEVEYEVRVHDMFRTLFPGLLSLAGSDPSREEEDGREDDSGLSGDTLSDSGEGGSASVESSEPSERPTRRFLISFPPSRRTFD